MVAKQRATCLFRTCVGCKILRLKPSPTCLAQHVSVAKYYVKHRKCCTSEQMALKKGRRIYFVIPRTSLYRGLLNRGSTIVEYHSNRENEKTALITLPLTGGI